MKSAFLWFWFCVAALPVLLGLVSAFAMKVCMDILDAMAVKWLRESRHGFSSVLLHILIIGITILLFIAFFLLAPFYVMALLLPRERPTLSRDIWLIVVLGMTLVWATPIYVYAFRRRKKKTAQQSDGANAALGAPRSSS
jgi:hypothetical protein